MSNQIHEISAPTLSNICNQLLIKTGVPDDQAEIITRAIVEADLRGIDSHGVLRLPTYLQRVKAGTMTAKTEMKIIHERTATILVDAQHGFGQVAGVYAMNQAMERASQHGIAAVAVRNAGHFGIAAFYAMLALHRRMVGMVIANSSACIAPWGGTMAMLGTNPVCVAIPTGGDVDIVLDMASSVVARGKIRLAQKKEIPIPIGWALDPDGLPTQDPGLAMKGTLLPIGGPKGYGIALIVDVLSGLMTGADYGPRVPETTAIDKKASAGLLFQAIDIAAFIEPELFFKELNAYADEIRNSPKSKGNERIYLPGEIEYLTKQKRIQQGIPIPVSLQADINKLAEELDIADRI